jgi:hypothetical protein
MRYSLKLVELIGTHQLFDFRGENSGSVAPKWSGGMLILIREDEIALFFLVHTADVLIIITSLLKAILKTLSKH